MELRNLERISEWLRRSPRPGARLKSLSQNGRWPARAWEQVRTGPGAQGHHVSSGGSEVAGLPEPGQGPQIEGGCQCRPFGLDPGEPTMEHPPPG